MLEIREGESAGAEVEEEVNGPRREFEGEPKSRGFEVAVGWNAAEDVGIIAPLFMPKS
jgi:hypothetical protein